MDFLFPLFLLAAIAVIIPVLIHLFNLRKYKHVYFSNVRFLKQLQISTKRSAQLQKKFLLLSRILFLLFLILAFAQPFLKSNQSLDKKNKVHLIYIDNSMSMSLKKNQQNELQKAKDQAVQLIQQAEETSQFMIIHNEKMSVGNLLRKKEAEKLVMDIDFSSTVVGYNQIISSISNAQENQTKQFLEVYLFSDFQQSTFLSEQKWQEEIKNIQINIFPFQQKSISNLYIDTAYFLNQELDESNQNDLFVKVKQSGEGKFSGSNLRVLIEGQTRAVKQIEEMDAQEWEDTISLQMNSEWQKVSLQIQDHNLKFDDTFRLTLAPNPNLSVLVIGNAHLNPYLQTGLNSYSGFELDYKNQNQLSAVNWSKYHLIILQNLNTINTDLENAVQKRLTEGGSILLFPGNNLQLDNINRVLENWAAINFSISDTTKQSVSRISENHPLIKDLFEKIPDNIQLPQVQQRYPINSGISSNQQSLMSFRDGSPFIAQYNVQGGKLFVCASGLENQSSDFPLSYFFVPLLYKMAVQNHGQHPSSYSIGSDQKLWISDKGSQEKRNMWHLMKADFEAIPEQKPVSNGTEISLKNLALIPGFYALKKEGSSDSLLIAVNNNSAESKIDYLSEKQLEEYFKPLSIHLLNQELIDKQGWTKSNNNFPFWKIAMVFALLSLLLETILLLRKKGTIL